MSALLLTAAIVYAFKRRRRQRATLARQGEFELSAFGFLPER